MNLRQCAFYLFIVVHLVLGLSRAETINESKTLFPGAQYIQTAIDLLPLNSGDRRGLEVWLKLVGIDKYGQVSQVENDLPGLQNFFNQKLVADYKFREELFQLNSWLRNEPESNIQNINGILLEQKAGAGLFKNKTPGFLWNKLLELSRQNPREALQILAAANHDSKKIFDLSLRPEFFLTSEERAELKLAIEKLKKEIPLSDSFNMLKSRIETLYDKMNYYAGLRNLNSDVNFSDSWLLDLPESLAVGMDISQDLKNKIHAYYRSSTVYAKFYHVHIAAFMTCEMISAGMSPAFAQYIQRWTGWGYRTVRLNLDLSKIFKKKANREPLTEDERIELLASRLMEEWFTGFHSEDKIYFPFSNIDFLDFIFKNKSEQIPDANETSNIISSLKGFPKPLFMKENDFKLAKFRLHRWVTDIEWTVAQHRLGASFGAQVCSQKLNR